MTDSEYRMLEQILACLQRIEAKLPTPVYIAPTHVQYPPGYPVNTSIAAPNVPWMNENGPNLDRTVG